MKYSTIMARLAKEYEHALVTKWVRKPLSYALFQTWRWCDTYEKERDSKSEKGQQS